MQTRTWPYGTKRRATVEELYDGVMVLIDELGEGHVLMGTGSDGQPGDVGTLTFTEGGPKGGYWKFEREASASQLERRPVGPRV